MTDFTGKGTCTCGRDMGGGGGSVGSPLSGTWRKCECGIGAFFYSLSEGYEIEVRAKPLNDSQVKEETKRKLLEVFDDAQISVLQSWDIRNKYHSSGDDWLLVRTNFGLITIGWRKRVINIDWSDTGIEHLVNTEATKWEGGCHAWDYQKAVDALISLKRSIAPYESLVIEGRV